MNLSDERYERLVLLILFETITIILFITCFDKLTSDLKKFIFLYAIVFLQMPFVSFIENDFLSRRPSLVEKITKWFINVLIFLVVLGVFAIIFLIDFKSGIVSTLVTLVFLIITNWKKIEGWFKSKQKKVGKK